ncbi:cytochrome c oxidase subunit II [Bradyrhizobium sp. CCGUVB14]|uniref:cytochrome c oxidase subunit II n=1 Tax=Bradyrhizobium sp. CCGUVB14 TaxID=2949628 RepID=UPI0020B427A9|nr:cytochrome c oxidase subunit II [Bradyrhizobium sp. CCGUVB14]MCP3442289.1 cytochrome c oxidase subunit II [Bradyrhizobium sp. CCGUVB14]
MLAVPLAACGSNWQSALDVHGTSAISLKHLILLIVAVCSVVWMLVMVALIWALWHRREGRPTSPEPGRERRMTLAVTGGVIATTAIIGTLTTMSFFATRNLSVAGQDDLTIRVRGLQWWWGLEYIGPDPARRFETANEIHIPVGRSVHFKLEGLDVIHSFWVPSLAGKQDLIPGRSNELTIRAEQPGVYRGQCAEYCGMQHAHMALLVIAESQDDFDKWSNAQRQAAPLPAGEEAAAGMQTFLTKPCAACHTIRGTTAVGTTGPDLTHVGSRRTIAAGLFETTRGSLAAWIADPQTIKPGNNMPMVPLTPDELRGVSAYLASLK